MFYVTIIRAKRVGFLLGPYPNHKDALDNVERARNLAYDVDGYTHFDAFGTCRWKDDAGDPPKSVFGL